MKKIIFQGDSITDASRSRDKDFNRGYGFATMVTGILGSRFPGEYTFLNRGVGGNRIADIKERNARDVIAEKPDYVGFLAGVNDVWYYLDKPGGFNKAEYRNCLEDAISEMKIALPTLKIIMLEPFVLPGSNTGEAGSDKYRRFRAYTEQCAEISKNTAEKFGCVYVKLQKMLDNAANTGGCAYWLMDGIHPTSPAHYLIALKWAEAFETNFLKDME